MDKGASPDLKRSKELTDFTEDGREFHCLMVLGKNENLCGSTREKGTKKLGPLREEDAGTRSSVGVWRRPSLILKKFVNLIFALLSCRDVQPRAAMFACVAP